MPSRIVQTICSVLFLITLYLVDKTSLSSIWIMVLAGIVVAAAFTMGTLVNTYWYANYPSRLNAYELNWVKRFVLFYEFMDSGAQEIFCGKLAHEMRQKEFISMSEKDLPEELKMMVLAPAVRLNLVCTEKEAAHYKKIIFYHIAFASPDQQYLHLSETQHDDGVLIFASDALEAAYLNPSNYFNTALYEWSAIFVGIHKIPETIQIDSALAWEVVNKILSTETKKLLFYLGQPSADHYALLCYCCIMYPEKLKKELPDFYEQIKKIID